MGQDNRFYYTLGVAGALLARGYPIPKNCSVQDFYKLEGEKFSTSRDHALWADEVAREVGPNVLRYALARVAKPFGTDANDFDLDGLISAASRIRVWEDALRRYAENARTVESTELSRTSAASLKITPMRSPHCVSGMRLISSTDTSS